jgi:hypothetical protein
LSACAAIWKQQLVGRVLTAILVAGCLGWLSNILLPGRTAARTVQALPCADDRTPDPDGVGLFLGYGQGGAFEGFKFANGDFDFARIWAFGGTTRDPFGVDRYIIATDIKFDDDALRLNWLQVGTDPACPLGPLYLTAQFRGVITLNRLFGSNSLGGVMVIQEECQSFCVMGQGEDWHPYSGPSNNFSVCFVDPKDPPHC